MSGGKFASLSAGLLVRKGEAMPSSVTASQAFSFSCPVDPPTLPARMPKDAHESESRAFEQAVDRPEVLEQIPIKKARETAPSKDFLELVKRHLNSEGFYGEQADRSRRLMVTLSPTEFETLGLIAVKRGMTRHRLLRIAFDEYLALLVDEYGGSCDCINSSCNCI